MYSVLLVEDEKIELETLRDYIDWKKLGIGKVYTARGGRSALECIAECEPDIMITDIQMPGMNGIELAKLVREEKYTCKLVFLTGYDEFEYAKSAFQVQAEDFILKPFQVEEVEQLVTRIISKIKREKHAEESIRIATGKIFEQAVKGEINEAVKERAEEYLQKEVEKEAFYILGVYGGESVELSKVLNLSEVVYAFEIDKILFIILNELVSVRDSANRIVKIMEENISVIYVGKKVSLLAFAHYRGYFLEMKDQMFFSPPSLVVCAEQTKVKKGQKKYDWEKYVEHRKNLCTMIIAADEEQALRELEICLDCFQILCKEECCKKAYSFYSFLNNEIVSGSQELIERMEQREERQKLEIMNIPFFGMLKKQMQEYVKELCAFYYRRLEDQNYYVVSWVKNTYMSIIPKHAV